jgi:hypothetical protein
MICTRPKKNEQFNKEVSFHAFFPIHPSITIVAYHSPLTAETPTQKREKAEKKELQRHTPVLP